MRSIPYMPQLNGLRVVAVLLVTVQHWFPNELLRGIPYGKIGVQTFFVLSGFLIMGILLSNNKRSFGMPHKERREYRKGLYRAFYARRFIRIFPLYYLVLFGCLLVFPLVRSDFPWHFFYLTNILAFLEGEWPPHMTHFWTLAIEEQFYLFVPLLAISLPIKLLPKVLAGIILMGLVGRIVLLQIGMNLISVQTFSLTAFDGLAIGSLLAYFKYHRNGSSLHPQFRALALLSCVAFLGLLCFLFCGNKLAVIFFSIFGATLFCFFISWVILYLSEDHTGFVSFLAIPPMIYFGKISYGIYVYHNFMQLAYRHITPDMPLFNSLIIRYLILLLMTLIVSSISWHFFENILNGIKGKFSLFKYP